MLDPASRRFPVTLPTPSLDLAIGDYTTLDLAVPDSRPARNCRPPSRFNDYIRY